MFEVAVVRFKNVGTVKERAFIHHLYYKTLKGVCRALRNLSWNFNYDHFEVTNYSDVEYWFYISNGYDFEQDFSVMKSYFEGIK